MVPKFNGVTNVNAFLAKLKTEALKSSTDLYTYVHNNVYGG